MGLHHKGHKLVENRLQKDFDYRQLKSNARNKEYVCHLRSGFSIIIICKFVVAYYSLYA